MNKKGSSSVFLVFIMAAMIGVTAVFIYAAKQVSYTGISDGVLNTGMRSVLSEFNLELKDRYGIMAFEKSGMEASLDINDYVDYTFDGNSPVKNIEVSFGGYQLSDVNVLKEQIFEYMELAIAEEVFDDTNDVERTDVVDRTLRNKAVIAKLPSKPFKDEQPGFIEKLETLKDELGSVEDILNKTGEDFLIDSYIMNHFKYSTGGPIGEPSFFDHEVEYILTGDFSNEKNRTTVERGLKLLRIALNTAYIYKDEEKKALTLAAAELLTPEAAPATQAVLITTWATAEADNDVKLLLKGRPVPFMKNEGSWATSLDNVLDNLTEGCIDTGNESGLYYSDYLRIFLNFEDEKIKLARIADLIQINMKGIYDKDFLMETSNCGLHLKGKVYGKELEYETCY